MLLLYDILSLLCILELTYSRTISEKEKINKIIDDVLLKAEYKNAMTSTPHWTTTENTVNPFSEKIFDDKVTPFLRNQHLKYTSAELEALLRDFFEYRANVLYDKNKSPNDEIHESLEKHKANGSKKMKARNKYNPMGKKKTNELTKQGIDENKDLIVNPTTASTSPMTKETKLRNILSYIKPKGKRNDGYYDEKHFSQSVVDSNEGNNTPTQRFTKIEFFEVIRQNEPSTITAMSFKDNGISNATNTVNVPYLANNEANIKDKADKQAKILSELAEQLKKQHDLNNKLDPGYKNSDQDDRTKQNQYKIPTSSYKPENSSPKSQNFYNNYPNKIVKNTSENIRYGNNKRNTEINKEFNKLVRKQEYARGTKESTFQPFDESNTQIYRDNLYDENNIDHEDTQTEFYLKKNLHQTTIYGNRALKISNDEKNILNVDRGNKYPGKLYYPDNFDRNYDETINNDNLGNTYTSPTFDQKEKHMTIIMTATPEFEAIEDFFNTPSYNGRVSTKLVKNKQSSPLPKFMDNIDQSERSNNLDSISVDMPIKRLAEMSVSEIVTEAITYTLLQSMDTQTQSVDETTTSTTLSYPYAITKKPWLVGNNSMITETDAQHTDSDLMLNTHTDSKTVNHNMDGHKTKQEKHFNPHKNKDLVHTSIRTHPPIHKEAKTKPTVSHEKQDESSWEKLKKFFGHDRVCNCKCKVNQTMCKVCAASDAVIRELMFEFENLSHYMSDHCTEIQTFFWMNPTGGKRLRDTVHRIDKSLCDYYKRVKGKCNGRTCKTFTSYLDKRNFKKKQNVEI